MIAPKVAKPTPAQEKWAYEVATDRDEGCCVRCGAFGAQRDHRLNRSQGGLTTPADLQLMCFDRFDMRGKPIEGCHKWKEREPKKAEAEGFRIPGWWSKPATEYPGRRRISPWELIWVLYDEEGGWTQITEDQALARIAGTYEESERA